MKVPVSWLKEFVELTLPLDELAHKLTMAGLEVEEIRYVGLPLPPEGRRETKISGMAWDPEKIVVGAILEVMPHPNADRLVLCRLDDGEMVHTVLTGAPNLFPYRGKGMLAEPVKVAYAKEGAVLYDGHKPGQELMTLKRAKIRGVESYSMACSEKELGISEEHEGIIILDLEAPVGMPLAEYMGDVVLDIAITPNIARNANILGVAREVSALTGGKLHPPEDRVVEEGPAIDGRVQIEIKEPSLNPRFVLGLIENIEIKPSPYEVQRRLRLAGVRPINNIVDATNYAMLEIGEPLHAFDYDVLVKRAGGKPPTIITRPAEQGEQLTTLDDVKRTLDDFTVLVCDTAGSLSIAGVMGGLESEVTNRTRNVLLEGAAWNYINVRRTVSAQNLPSEAAYRFSRGVHPELAPRGVRRGLELMRRWSAGVVSEGLVDAYPLPPEDPQVKVTPGDVYRWLGIRLTPAEIARVLASLDFETEIKSEAVLAQTPPHRLDIGLDVVGVADLMEEIARIYGYERIPETRLHDALPPQRNTPAHDYEERVRDHLVDLGLQEVVTYRMTSPGRENRRLAPGTPPLDRPFTYIANPIVSDRNALRQDLLASVLEVVERNARLRERIALFEISPVFLQSESGDLPDEVVQVVIVLTGRREPQFWQAGEADQMDFYDLKGILHGLLSDLHIPDLGYVPAAHPTFHPGKCARVLSGETSLGVLGELHPLVQAAYDLPFEASERAVAAAVLTLETLRAVTPERYEVQSVPPFPPVLEDLALIVAEDLPAARVEAEIRTTGGEMLSGLSLFDVYRGQQIGADKKSLAYNLTYQAPDRTLTDKEVANIRARIIRRLEEQLGARLRS